MEQNQPYLPGSCPSGYVLPLCLPSPSQPPTDDPPRPGPIACPSPDAEPLAWGSPVSIPRLFPLYPLDMAFLAQQAGALAPQALGSHAVAARIPTLPGLHVLPQPLKHPQEPQWLQVGQILWPQALREAELRESFAPPHPATMANSAPPTHFMPPASKIFPQSGTKQARNALCTCHTLKGHGHWACREGCRSAHTDLHTP